MWHGIATQLRAATGLRFEVDSATPVGGGSINRAWRVDADKTTLFVKTHAAGRREMFAAEAAGLRELADAGALRVPGVVATGVSADHAFLALEWIDFGARTEAANRRLGVGLAALHRHTADRYGWYRDNTIGSTAQINTQADDWWRFFVERRLLPQLALAGARGAAGRQLAHRGERLCDRVSVVAATAPPPPALLHGDLWGGNWAATADGEALVFDPAVYYGDPETDIAMTELFGGFTAGFYAAYRETMPQTDGAPLRREVYKLYHLLNHYNLFGGGYAAQTATAMEKIAAALARP